MKARRVTVWEKTFGLVVRIQVGGTLRSAKAECERHCDVEPTGDLTHTNGWAVVHNCYGFIYLNEWPESHRYGTFGTLVHELVHIVRGFLRDVGSKDEETHANLTQFLYAESHKKLDR
jgi:hypothetical protein